MLGLAKSLAVKGRLCSFAEISEESNRNDEGIAYADEAIAIAEENGLVNQLAEALYAKADLLINKNRWVKVIDRSLYKEAEAVLAKADKLLPQTDSSNVRRALSTTLRFLRQGGQHKKAIQTCNEFLELCGEEDYGTLFQLYDNLSNLYASIGDLDNASECHLKTVYYMNLFSRQKSEKSLQEMETRYETAIKEQIIEKQSIVSRHKTATLILLCIALLAMIVVAYRISRLRKRVADQNEELKEANATRDKLFAIISHDLKNMTNAQKTGLKGLVINEAKLTPEFSSAVHKELLKSAESQSTLVNNLLDWSRVQTKSLKFNPGVFDLSKLVNDCVAANKGLADAKGLEVTMDLNPPCHVEADMDMVSVIIRNLFTNAIKFTGKNGKIEVTTRDEGEFISCTVKDSGIGMEQEDIDRLLNTRSLESRRGTEGEKGTGLGLNVCKTFIERNGGTLSIESAPGSGSAFTFTLKKT